MAFAADDIARLRASIPEAFRARDASGALTQRFRDLETFNRSLAYVSNPDAGESHPGFRLSGGLARVRDARAEQRRKDEREKIDRFSLAQAKAALDQRIAELDAELAAIDKSIHELRDRQAAIGQQLEAMDEIARLKREGKFDPRNNAAHARMAQAAGLSPDEAESEDLLSLIARRRHDLTDENDDIDERIAGLVKRRGEVVIERDGALAARTELEGATTEEARILATRRADTVLGKRQLATAANASADHSAKVAAADAVGNAETPDRRAASVALNRDAVEGDRAAVFKSDGADFELGSRPAAARPPTPR